MIEILRNRRSVRKFKNKFIEPEKIEILNDILELFGNLEFYGL
jgi:nitroreductase